jgi:lipid-A-disaccharide synthase-like uncharacterized protein
MTPDPSASGLLDTLNPDHIPWGWLVLGFTAQAMFSARFLVQWVVSERARESVVPTLFWWLSVSGGSLLLGYALLRADPVIALGQSAGLIVYVRNLVLIRRKKRAELGAA